MLSATRSALLTCMTAAVLAPFCRAQAPVPFAVPDPLATVAAGTGTASTTTCTTGIAVTSGTNYGDGCAPATAGLAAPQGVSVDKLGNIYIADYTDRLVRVVYMGGTQLAAAITAANSGYAISATRNAPAPTPVAGNIYTLAGVGTSFAALSTTNAAGSYYCANYAGISQPTALNSLGDGCPAASAPIGPRAVTSDADGNLFLTDFTDGRVRVLCVNCATTTAAAQLITLENPGVAPVNGAMYTLVGYANGYRDAAPGFNAATGPTVSVALLRSPSFALASSADDVYIADQGNNAVRLLYNGGAQALALLTAEGISTPIQGYVYTVAGASCVSAPLGKTGSVTSANSCMNTTPTDGVAGNASGVGTPWSIFLDPNQNLFIGDGVNGRVRAIYGGVANPLTLSGTLTVGDIYTIAGTGSSTANGITPSQLMLSATAAEGVSGDASGNLFIVDYVKGVIYEVYAPSGTLTALVGNSPAATITAGGACGSGTNATSTDVLGDGCPAVQSKLTSPRGPVAVDTAGNLYFGDSNNNIVHKYSYPAFPATAVGTTSATQLVTFTYNTLGSTTELAGTAEFPVSNVTVCANTVLCSAQIAFAPLHPGFRAGAARVTNPDTTQVAASPLSAIGLGAALDSDATIAATTGTGLQPAGVAYDASGNLLVSDLASKSVIRYTGSTATTLATGFTAPAGLVADGAGNIYVADSSANTVRVIPGVNSATAGMTPYTLLTGLKSPHGLALDANGDLLIANTGSNQILLVTPNGTLPAVVPFSGLNAPQAVGIDVFGDLYAADTGNARVVRLTPAGAQTVVASVVSNGLALDAAANLYAFSGTSLNEYPVTSTGVTVPLTTGLVTPRALALDSSGNVAVADTSKTGVLTLNRAVASALFTSSPGSASFTVTSTGNTAFVPATPFLTSSNTTQFTVSPSTTNGCSGSLAPGITCGLTATFSATVPGTYTDTVSYNGNATDAPGLSLTGTNTAETTTTTFTASPTSVTYGTAILFTAMVKGSATTPNSGTVAFTAAGNTLGSANVGNGGIASVSLVLPAGVLQVSATYTPATAGYTASTSASQTITVAQAVLTVTATSASRQFGVANPPFTYSITGFVNGDTQASATTGAPTETTTATATSPQGKYPLVITQGTLAASNYTFSFVNGTLTITPAVPANVLVASATTSYVGTSVLLTATLSSSVGTPTGTVTFYSGSTSLGAVMLTNGTASLNTTALPQGTDTVTAVYGGDGFFGGVTSNPVVITVGAGFGIAASSSTLIFPSGYQEAQSVLTINPGGRNDTLAFACMGLPARVSCAFSPSTLPLAGLAGPQTVTLLVSNSNATAALQPSGRGAPIVFAGILLACFAGVRRRRLSGRLLGVFAALLLGLSAVAGCGSSTPMQSTGTYNFNVVITSGSSTVQTLPYTLTIQ